MEYTLSEDSFISGPTKTVLVESAVIMSNILKMKLKQLLLSFELEMGCFVKFVKIYDGGVWPETETVPQTQETIN